MEYTSTKGNSNWDRRFTYLDYSNPMFTVTTRVFDDLNGSITWNDMLHVESNQSLSKFYNLAKYNQI